MSEEKICPVWIAAGFEDMNKFCDGEICAWYTRGACAITILARRADDAISDMQRRGERD